MQLGKTNLQITDQGLGCMSMSEFYGKPLNEADGVALIVAAYENGVRFFDTADVYGYGRNEVLIGKAVTELMGKGINRSDLIIATKCGILRDEHDPTRRGVDNSYEYVLSACDKSLGRLGADTAYIDLFYLHRITPHGTQIDESMRAMASLLKEGKIKAVGLSEATPEMIRSANEALLKYTDGAHQIAAVQSEYSLLTRNIEGNGVLDICRELGITFVAYSPLSRALLTGEVEDSSQFEESDFRRSLPRFQGENLEHNKNIVKKVQDLARAKHCSPTQIALAWVMHQQGVVPIPGTTKLSHLLSNVSARDITLSEQDLEILNKLESAQGYRYTEAAMRAYGFEDELSSSAPRPS